MRSIDLNADLGEGGSQDTSLIRLASSANIACGGHAGDERTMRTAIESCIAAGVTIGAHPGYEDPEYFGRRMLDVEPAAVADMVSRQIERLAALALLSAVEIHHVKPHGALYNQANTDARLAAAVVTGVTRILPGCAFYVPPHGALSAAGLAAGLSVRAEGFADRRYQRDGSLTPRDEEIAVIENPKDAAAQAVEIACNRRVRTTCENFHPLPAATLCVHGDGPHAVTILKAVRHALEDRGFTISH